MTNVVIVGAGKGGRALLEMFAGDPAVAIVGVADLNPWAPGIELARRLNVRVTTDFRELIADAGVDLVIDVTGDAEVSEAIQQLKTPSTDVMGGIGARFMWDLLAERKRSEELEDRYSLVVRELQAQASSAFILGQNPKMREVAELLARVAPTPWNAMEDLTKNQEQAQWTLEQRYILGSEERYRASDGFGEERVPVH